MARPSKPWYRTSRKAWFVTIAGRTINLGPDKDAAFREFHRLMLASPPAGQSSEPPLAQLVEPYLADLATRAIAGTVRTTRVYLTVLARAAGTCPPTELPAKVTAHPTWTAQTQRLVLSRLAALYVWARKKGLSTARPIEGVSLPPPRSRGSRALLTANQLEALLAACRRPLRDALEALYDTGARPSELLAVTAAVLDEKARAWVFAQHKGSRKTGQPRIIHLTTRVLARCLELARLYPTGPLYRSDRGPYRDTKSLSDAFRRAARRAKLPLGPVLYGLRHGFATDALACGTPDTLVAALLGHVDTRMVHLNYSHVGERSRELKDALCRMR